VADDNLDEWQEVLAGRRSAPATSTASRLRKVILDEERRLDENIRANHPTNELALEELRYRVRQAQLRRKRPARRFILPLALAASVVLVATVLVYELRGPAGSLGGNVNAVSSGTGVPVPASGSSGSAGPVVEARVTNPQQVAQALQRELAQVNIQATVEGVSGGYDVVFTFEPGGPVTIGRDVINGGVTVTHGPNRIHLVAPR